MIRQSAQLLCALVSVFSMAGVYAQPATPAQTPQPPKAAAPFDLTGYWVSLVTEDWRWRMLTAPKGDYDSVPLNPEGLKVAKTWNPKDDEASGNSCKAYGAAAIMRVPTRLHITWSDDSTLKIETDAGQQTRTFYFDAPKARGGDWQGVSRAEWDIAGRTADRRLRGGLKVFTTNMKAGYLRKNGVPYSANATVTEYFDRVNEPWGDSYLIVRTMVDDPKYLLETFITSSHFKREPDAARWAPAPCSAQ